jgi:hypothetical protein
MRDIDELARQRLTTMVERGLGRLTEMFSFIRVVWDCDDIPRYYRWRDIARQGLSNRIQR